MRLSIISLGALLAGASLVNAAEPPSLDAKRNIMHANRVRQIEYLSGATAGAVAKTIPFEVAQRLPIDGPASLNDFAGLEPIDVDGDGVWEWVHYNGSKLMRIYDSAGKKLWQIADPAGTPHRDPTHTYSMAVWDFDGDGGQDIVHCWEGNAAVVMRDGLTGAVMYRHPVPKIDDDCHAAAYYFEGGEQPIILVALPSTLGNCPSPRNRSSQWARVRALDAGFNRLWQNDFCAAGHAPHQLDADADGEADALFLGKYKIDAQGNILCTLAIGNDHADGLQIGDIIPSRDGFEVAQVGERGGTVWSATNCAQIWRTQLANPQSVAIADLDLGRAGLEVVMMQRPSEQSRTIHIYEGGGKLIKSMSGRDLKFSRVNQSTNVSATLDDMGPQEVLAGSGAVFNQNGIVIANNWFTADGQRLDSIVLDIMGDTRPEVITGDRDSIMIGRIVGSDPPPEEPEMCTITVPCSEVPAMSLMREGG